MKMVEIIRAADTLLATLQITEPMVDVFELARMQGLDIKYRIFDKPWDKTISGFLHPTDKTIYINYNESPERQTYTIAHELGHFYLGHKPSEYGVYLRSASQGATGKKDIEKAADAFAANLLMPEEMVQRKVREYKLTSREAGVLASMFGVSESAMRVRLQTLGIT